MSLITNFKLLKEYGISILKSGGGRWTAASGTLQVTNHSGGVAVSAETPEAALAQCLAISYPELTEQTEGFIESMPGDIEADYQGLFEAAKGFIDSMDIDTTVSAEQEAAWLKYRDRLDQYSIN